MNPPAFLVIAGEPYPIVSIEPGWDRDLLHRTMSRLPAKIAKEAKVVLTFYDGPVTNDKKLDGIHRNTRNLLRDLFEVPS